MFERVELAPADPILGLTAAFEEDPNPDKINLGVGVYCDARGNTPVFRAVATAESQVLAAQSTKDYLPIDGTREYGAHVQSLLFGQTGVLGKRAAVTVQAPGGTGALRVAADFMHQLFPTSSLWLSEPTWANHPRVFQAAGVGVRTYPYFDPARNGIDFEPMRAALADVAAGDVVLLHGCCHNPTGVDPTGAQWKLIGEALADAGAIPLVDFAYQGLGTGLEEDAAGLRELFALGTEMFVASSFSKNFGLYQDRAGALTVVAASGEDATRVLSQLKVCVRTNFSNPPAHGSAIVTQVLGSDELRPQWQRELEEMRDRINGVRKLFVQKLRKMGASRDFSFIEKQLGMFSFSGLSPEQVGELREKHSIYIVGSGRINVAGMTPANIDRLCAAICEVL